MIETAHDHVSNTGHTVRADIQPGDDHCHEVSWHCLNCEASGLDEVSAY